jgi:hypothetical protein
MRKTRFSAVLLTILLVAVMVVGAVGGCGSKASKPEITNLDPSSGLAGTQVNIVGTNLGDSQGNSVVHVGVKVADVVSWSNVLVTAKIPVGLDGTMQPVSILTGGGESNELSLQVLKKDLPPQPDNQIESVTPIAAMQAYQKKKGVSTVGWTFSVVKLSAKDPNWKIDQGGKAGGAQTYFLLHNVPTAKINPNWTVIDAAASFTPQKLAADGAPADLQMQLPPPVPPQPQPKTQVILDYLKSKGIDTSAVAITLVNESKIDPTWELFNADWPAEAQIPDALVVLHQESGQWVVKNYGQDISNTPGMPGDLQLPK